MERLSLVAAWKTIAVQRWDLTAIETPGGSTSPVVLHSDEARAVLIGLQPGQALGEHEVKEGAWVLVVEGRATFERDGERSDAAEGTLVHFEPTERRRISSAGGARLLLLLTPWPGVGHYRAEEMEVF
jgi:quercetin dioxygenase-like cupin family protein